MQMGPTSRIVAISWLSTTRRRSQFLFPFASSAEFVGANREPAAPESPFWAGFLGFGPVADRLGFGCGFGDRVWSREMRGLRHLFVAGHHAPPAGTQTGSGVSSRRLAKRSRALPGRNPARDSQTGGAPKARAPFPRLGYGASLFSLGTPEPCLTKSRGLGQSPSNVPQPTNSAEEPT